MTHSSHARRLTAVAAMTAIAGLALAGCAGSGSGGGSSDAPQDGFRAVEAALEKGGELTYWSWTPSAEAQVAAFEEAYPNVDVKLVNAGTNTEEYTKLQNAITAGSGAPDVAQVEYYAIPQFALSDSLVDLAPYGFGDLEDHPVVGSDPENPGLVLIHKGPDTRAEQYENAWHCDTTWRERPQMGAVLRCTAAPAVGGDMLWANMGLAYEKLPEHIKTQIAGLRARHSIEASFGAAMPIERRLALHAQFPDAEHPVVRTHPETGEKVLFVNAFTTHFTNFHTAQNVRFGQDASPGASHLLNYLISQAFVPEYQVRFR